MKITKVDKVKINKIIDLFTPRKDIVSQKHKFVGIKYPVQPSECEVQYIIFGCLRKLHVDARLQVSSIDKKCIFDIVIFNKNMKAIAIIEVKKYKTAFKKLPFKYEISKVKQNKKQIHKYSEYRLPLFVACGMKSVKEAITWGWKISKTESEKGIIDNSNPENL